MKEDSSCPLCGWVKHPSSKHCLSCSQKLLIEKRQKEKLKRINNAFRMNKLKIDYSNRLRRYKETVNNDDHT